MIDGKEAAELLGLKVAVFAQLRRAAGLPDPIEKVGNACFYDRDQLIDFAKNNDVAKMIKDTRQKIRSGGKSIRAYNRSGKFVKKLTAKPIEAKAMDISNSMINRFLRGEFMPKEQQAERKTRLANARLNPPKRHIVNLSDIYWCD